MGLEMGGSTVITDFWILLFLSFGDAIISMGSGSSYPMRNKMKRMV